ncbi:hypothetical protein HPB48_009814 [Haemaphysalis longicornis]|uniref:C2H2-type domain-containing protein n=1 Tax=Haemaphysalis longicornis TaxID=44386 RepID=A0A9J6H230_HAELO|nr:hypothetical protein HPB48_009814 [Haemaphysalis longicornis]
MADGAGLKHVEKAQFDGSFSNSNLAVRQPVVPTRAPCAARRWVGNTNSHSTYEGTRESNCVNAPNAAGSSHGRAISRGIFVRTAGDVPHQAAVHAHRKTHSVEQPAHKCEECHKTFSRPGGLSSQRSIHTCDKHYECHICQRRCATRHGLKAHLRAHENIAGLKCNACEKSFLYRWTLLRTHPNAHACFDY